MIVPFPKALLWIFLSVLCVSGVAFSAYGFYHHFWNLRSNDPKYHLTALVQTGPEKEPLTSSFLAELLGLSIDRPVNLYKFNLERGENLLLSFPLIQKAELKRIPPSTLFVDYTIRKPIAFLADVSNTAVDAKGVLIPFHPFFSPKRLPEIVVGLKKEDVWWGKKITDPRFEIAFKVLFELEHLIEESFLRLIKVDTSKAIASSLGDQRIIVVLEERENAKGNRKTLILNPDSFKDGWNRFIVFQKSKGEDKFNSDFVFDLRLPKLGYIY